MAPPVEGNLSECLYVTLGVERSVDPDKLKIAYRKMAMKWHPDKIQQSGVGSSPNAYQEATERFQQINRAYEILSDPVERSWYDSHRERILSASSSSANAAPGEFDLNLWSFFSPSAFSGFGDTGSGFYAVYREIFKKVHLQEQVFGRMYGNRDVGDVPEFGGRDTPYQNVYSFYRHWQGFSSVKDFGWCDEFDVLQAPNRKVRRLMEEENNKVRKRERREFNNVVRQLAAFVKKRDKRVIEKRLELQMQQNQKEVERKARQLALERQKQEQIRLYKEQAWTVASEGEDWDSEEESDDDGTVKLEKTVPDAECMICGKKFKSTKQLQNHERSKKHLMNLAALKGAFRNDDEQVERLGRQLGIDISFQQKPKRTRAVVEPCETKGSETVDKNSEDEEASVAEIDSGEETVWIPDIFSDDNHSPGVSKSHDDSGDDVSLEKDILGRESRSDELEDDDDDKDMLATLLKSQHSRQTSAEAPETNIEEAELKRALSESGVDDGERVVAAMSNLELNDQEAEPSLEVRQSDADDSAKEAGAHGDSVSEEKDLEGDKKTKSGKATRRAMKDRTRVLNRFSEISTDLEQRTANGGATEGPSAAGDSAVEPLTRQSDGVSEDKDLEGDEKPKKRKQRRRALKDRESSAASRPQLPFGTDLGNSAADGATFGSASTAESSESARVVKELRQQVKHVKLAERGKKNKKEKKGANQDSHTCQTCGEDFASRTQLFKHIAATNHASLKSK